MKWLIREFETQEIFAFVSGSLVAFLFKDVIINSVGSVLAVFLTLSEDVSLKYRVGS
jgi:hypothetical protein